MKENKINVDIFYKWLSNSIGKPLSQAKALFHIFNGACSRMPQEISLLFGECEFGKVYCSSDGESISFSLSALVGRDLGEYGENEIFPISNNKPFVEVMQKKLISVSVLYSVECKKEVGIFFVFENNNSFSIINLGDELFIFDCLPENIVVEERLSLIGVV